MALFNRKQKKNTEKRTEKQTSAPRSAVLAAADRDLSSVIIKPRITEKAVGQSERNVYVFTVRRDATKHDVRDAVKAHWGVTPVKVNIVNATPRQLLSRRLGRTITEKGIKKAYVYLKSGESINIV